VGFFPLISFLAYLLFVYGKTTDFCMLILCPVASLKVFSRSKSLLVRSLRSFKFRLISKCKKRQLDFFLSFLFLSFFPLFPFISFYCLIGLAQIYSTTLNKNGGSGHLYLGPIIEEVFSVFPHLVQC
jgi:hypothetical protein